MSRLQISKIQDLPQSTAECDIGPEVVLRPGRVSIRYDNEAESGVVWTELLFTTAIALRVTPDSAVTEDLLSAYSQICEIERSPWLESFRTDSRNAELPRGLRHFVVYFDHFGAVEIAATSFTVGAGGDD